MAKMFVSLEEVAEMLGVDEEQVKEMASEGTLQQFRDRDKLMFKREQVEQLANGGGGSASAGDDTDELQLADEGDDTGVENVELVDEEPIEAVTSEVLPGGMPDDTGTGEFSLADETSMGASLEAGVPTDSTESLHADAIDLADDEDEPAEKSDSRHATGVSVFDADEVEAADPSAATQVSSPAVDEEELALESVASGSGLLDLTRESDDTSLGAELLDEIYPAGSGTESLISESSLEAPPGSSPVFDDGTPSDAVPSPSNMSGSSSGLANIDISDDADSYGSSGGNMLSYNEPFDPAGSGLGAGLLFGCTIALIFAAVLGISMVSNVAPPAFFQNMGRDINMLYAVCGGILAGSIVFGIIGLLVGKKLA